MATVTQPPILDATGLQIADKLDGIEKALAINATPATTASLGVVQPDGQTIFVDEDGVISSSGAVAPATTASLGTVQPDGTSISITESGVISSIHGSILNLTTEDTDLYNQPITVTISGATYSATFSSVGTASISRITQSGVAYVTITDGSTTQTDQIEMPYYGSYNMECWLGTRYDVNITTSESTLYGQAVTMTNGTTTYTATFSLTGTASIVTKLTGTFTVTATDGSQTASENVTITSGTSVYTVSLSFMTKKTFAAATDAEIAEMVANADAGKLDLYTDCGWRVGQEHTTTLAAIAASGTFDGVSWTVGESQSSQTVTLVLMHRGLYTLVTPVKNKDGSSRSTCSFVVGLKNSLGTYGYMNSTNTNNGSWNSSARRNWCNGGFRQAINSTLRAAFKKFNCITGTWSNNTAAGGSNITSQDYFALPAGKEVFNGGSSTSYSTDNEANALTQFTWYETAANRIKTQGDSGSAWLWWERSPRYYSSNYFCYVYTDGTAGSGSASSTYGLSPFGCI